MYCLQDKIKHLSLHRLRNKTNIYMVTVAQSVRASVCGSEGRGFESHQPP